MSKPLLVLARISLAALAFVTLTAATHHKVYDPERDPAQDLETAKIEAAAQGKKILLSVGGDWCLWCLRLDDFLSKNKVVSEDWNRAFVTVKVNISDRNMNEKFLAGYPRIVGVPQFFILDSDGTLLSSQRTNTLEEGKSYSTERMLGFVYQWASPTDSTEAVAQTPATASDAG